MGLMGVQLVKDIYIALVHHPVLSKKGEVICSAVTNLDIHDIARAGKTYGVKGYFIITTLSDQKVLVDKIIRHWTEGHGGDVNPDRKQALELVSIVDSVDEAVSNIQSFGRDVTVVSTTAKQGQADTTFGSLRAEMSGGGNYLLLFGTAWGLADKIISASDKVLEPLQSNAEYNHLSVRSAASIVMDRLLSEV